MTISSIHLVILKPMGIMESFHDSLCYPASVIDVKSTSRLRLNVYCSSDVCGVLIL